MKYALIIGNNKYDDPKLAQLKTPAADSHALAKVLADKDIGFFDEVSPLINKTETEIRRAISSFLANKKPDDLVLVYFSGHGILDDRGRLFLGLKDTETILLKATAIPSTFISDEMDSCRSKRQILILDCCHSGAFARGTKGEQKAVTEATFEGSGYGRVVMTASDSTQYALEGDQVISQTDLSLFTHFLLEGLKTGEADINNDGHISLDEWYDYTYARVISETPKQVPHRWSYNQQGDLIIARNPYLKKRVVELPHELLQALESPFVGIRESAVTELSKYLRSRDPEMVELAISALEKMKGDDSRSISLLAEKFLSEYGQGRIPTGQVMSSKPPAEIESPSGTRASRPNIEKTNLSVDGTQSPQGLGFNSSFWSKWLGIAMLAIVFSIASNYYNLFVNYGASILAQLIGVVAGLSGFIQWLVFRDRLEIWWVGVNAAAGFGLGLLHGYLYTYAGWGYSRQGWVYAIWIVGNFIVGIILLRRTQEKSKNSSAIVGIGVRQNIFLIALSVSLILAAISNFSLVVERYDSLLLTWIFYGIAAILTGISIILIKEIPRNFGFMTLAIFLLLDGINVLLLAFNSDYPRYYFILTGILALVSGIFFVSQREIWKNFGFIMFSGYLLTIGAASVNVYTTVNHAFLGISVIFAIPAAVFFFLRK